MRVIPVLLSVVCAAYAYPLGAPTSRCESMQPGHGAASTDPNPHAFSVSSTSYTAGGTVEVTISGTIKGLLLQARKADGTSTTPYGTFSVQEADAVKVIKCSNDDDAVTHSATDEKTDLKVTWTAPDSDMGDLMFIATVNEEKNTYWMNMKSATITFSDDSASTRVGTSTTMVLATLASALFAIKLLQ